MRSSTAPTCRPRSRSTRRLRSPRSIAAPTRPASSTACSARSPASARARERERTSVTIWFSASERRRSRWWGVNRLREISERLNAIARELEGEEAEDGRAAALAQEAAELSAEAVEEANRRIREGEAASQ